MISVIKSWKNVPTISHSTVVCCCQLFHINSQTHLSKLMVSHCVSTVTFHLTITSGRFDPRPHNEKAQWISSSIQLSQVEKAPEHAWIKCLFSSCFDKSSADTSLRAQHGHWFVHALVTLPAILSFPLIINSILRSEFIVYCLAALGHWHRCWWWCQTSGWRSYDSVTSSTRSDRPGYLAVPAGDSGVSQYGEVATVCTRRIVQGQG